MIAKVKERKPARPVPPGSAARARPDTDPDRPDIEVDDGLDDAEDTREDAGRQFINVLARGLEVLSAFRRDDPPLSLIELARRTGMPKPTVARIAFTLTRVGYLSRNARNGTYGPGGAALSLGFVAQSFSVVQG